MDAIPTGIEFAPELEAAITPDATGEFSVPRETAGELVIEVVDQEGIKWRYAFLAMPKLVAHVKASEQEVEFAKRAREVFEEVMGE